MYGVMSDSRASPSFWKWPSDHSYPFPELLYPLILFLWIALLDISHAWNRVPGSVTSCFLMAMFAVHSCCTYQCWHMPDPIPCMNIGPCFSIYQLVNVWVLLFGPYEQCSRERVCTSFYKSMHSVLLGIHPCLKHKTGRWHGNLG